MIEDFLISSITLKQQHFRTNVIEHFKVYCGENMSEMNDSCCYCALTLSSTWPCLWCWLSSCGHDITVSCSHTVHTRLTAAPYGLSRAQH